MGLLDKLLGGREPEHPPLDDSSPAAVHLKALEQPLAKLADETEEPLEVVPLEETLYVFIGRPPKKFGVAWIDADGKINNFKTLVDEQGLSVITLEKLSEQLKKRYIKHREEPRYSAVIGGERRITVTPAAGLAADVKKIIMETVS